VDPDRRHDEGPEPLEPAGLRGFDRVPGLQNDHRALDSGLSGAVDDGLEVAGERLVGDGGSGNRS
jgi:hypothetical protein